MNVQELYISKMHPIDLNLDAPDARFTVRIWDGMDGCWTDCPGAIAVDAATALKAWANKTDNGTKRIRFDEIDYYRIFPAETRMVYDNDNEMFRDQNE
jgi:hypothetical protein